jgi:hypothetical protein
MAGEDRLNQPASATGLKEALETTVVTDLDADPKGNAQWDAFVASSPHGHLLQTSHWGTLKAHFGWKVERLVLMDEGKIVAGALVHYRSLPLGVGRLAYVPMGPVVDWDNEELVFTLLATLRQAVQRRRSFSLKIEPSLVALPPPLRLYNGKAPSSLTWTAQKTKSWPDSTRSTARSCARQLAKVSLLEMGVLPIFLAFWHCWRKRLDAKSLPHTRLNTTKQLTTHSPTRGGSSFSWLSTGMSFWPGSWFSSWAPRPIVCMRLQGMPIAG